METANRNIESPVRNAENTELRYGMVARWSYIWMDLAYKLDRVYKGGSDAHYGYANLQIY